MHLGTGLDRYTTALPSRARCGRVCQNGSTCRCLDWSPSTCRPHPHLDCAPSQTLTSFNGTRGEQLRLSVCRYACTPQTPIVLRVFRVLHVCKGCLLHLTYAVYRGLVLFSIPLPAAQTKAASARESAQSQAPRLSSTQSRNGFSVGFSVPKLSTSFVLLRCSASEAKYSIVLQGPTNYILVKFQSRFAQTLVFTPLTTSQTAQENASVSYGPGTVMFFTRAGLRCARAEKQNTRHLQNTHHRRRESSAVAAGATAVV